MLIDWFTVAAQVANFLILVALLRYFLYGRILRAITEREQKIAAQLDEAGRKKREAEDLAESYRQKNDAWERMRRDMLGQAGAEAEARRKELMEEAREEVDQLKARWREAIGRDQASFRRDLKTRTAHELLATVRRALRDLAEAELETQMIRCFRERLGQLDTETRAAMGDSLERPGSRIVIRTAFDLSEKSRDEIARVVQDGIGTRAEVRFESVPEMIAGIEIKVNGRKLGWSLESYLAALEERIAGLVGEEVSQSVPPPEGVPGGPKTPQEKG